MNHTSDNEFAYGSGHINPTKATNSGLVYQIFENGYLNMLCNLNYTDDILRIMSGDQTIICNAEASKKGAPKDLNYPSMTAQVRAVKPINVTFKRRVKNVGSANSTYGEKVIANIKIDNVSVSVTPSVLSFTSLNEEKGFEVSVTGKSSSFVLVLFCFYGLVQWKLKCEESNCPVTNYPGDD